MRVSATSLTVSIVGERGGCYAFACPTCDRREGRPADARVLQLLAETCATLRSIPDPAGLEVRPEVDPLTMREVALTCARLADDEWFDAALAALFDEALEI